MRRTVLPWRARRTVLLRRIRRSFTAKLVAPVSLYVDYAVAVRHVVDEIVPDVVHAHDLNTLPAGVVAARRNGAKLIYDSHELELHRNQAWSRWKRFLARSFEFIGMRRADGVVTVSPLIAQHLARTYRVRRPTVLLNSPPLLTRSLEPAIDLRACAGLTHTDRLVVYVGTIGYRRGLDKLIQALALMPADFHVGFLGPRQPVRERPLLELGKQLGVETRMHFFGPVPAEQVPATLSGANGAVNPAPNVCLSYDLALPNKLFDAVMAGIPIGVGQLRHLSEFVIEHDVGVVFDEEDPSSIASALYQMNERWLAGLVDSDGLDELQTSVAWEVQEAQLYALYAALGLAPSRRTTAIVEPVR
jgi:glycosyltransferase involved in cell wall biosynthesis